MASPIMQYASNDIDKDQYYICGLLHPQHAGMAAATLSLLMYVACLIYLCSTGYWYALATLFIAVLCWGEFMYGTARLNNKLLKPLILLSAIFTVAIAAHIGAFIYFTVATEGDGTEYEVMIGFLSAFFVLNIICLRIILSCSTFVSNLRTYLAHQGSIGAYSDDSVSSVMKGSPRSTITGGSITSELPQKQGLHDQASLAPSYQFANPQTVTNPQTDTNLIQMDNTQIHIDNTQIQIDTNLIHIDNTLLMDQSRKNSLCSQDAQMQAYLNEVVNERQPDLFHV